MILILIFRYFSAAQELFQILHARLWLYFTSFLVTSSNCVSIDLNNAKPTSMTVLNGLLSFKIVLTEFLKTVQIYFKRYPTCIWCLKRVEIVCEVSVDHFQSTLFAIEQEKWLLKQLNCPGTETGKGQSQHILSTVHDRISTYSIYCGVNVLKSSYWKWTDIPRIMHL